MPATYGLAPSTPHTHPGLPWGPLCQEEGHPGPQHSPRTGLPFPDGSGAGAACRCQRVGLPALAPSPSPTPWPRKGPGGCCLQGRAQAPSTCHSPLPPATSWTHTSTPSSGSPHPPGSPVCLAPLRPSGQEAGAAVTEHRAEGALQTNPLTTSLQMTKWAGLCRLDSLPDQGFPGPSQGPGVAPHPGHPPEGLS